MPEPITDPVKTKPKPPRGWFRRALRWLLVLGLIAAVFHRPLILGGARLALIAVAARMHLKVDLHLSGNVFTNLTVAGIRADPVGDFPNPIHRLAIDRVRLDYSIPRLVKHGLGEFLGSYEIINADLQIDALPGKKEEKKPEVRRERQSIGALLNTILGQPALYSDRVKIENFNLTVRAEKNVTIMRGFHLLLDPQQPGALRVARLEIPGVPLWENLAAETSYEARNFYIRHLQLAPELSLDEMNFDASQRAQNKGSMQFKLHAFGGTAEFTLEGSQLNKKGENLAKSYDTALTVEAAGVSIDRALAYFQVSKLPVEFGTLAHLGLHFAGEPEKPRTWRGDVGVRVAAFAFDKTKIDTAELTAIFKNGRAEVSGLHAGVGKNTATLTAQIALPESVNDFPKCDLDAMLRLDAPDLPALTAMLVEPLTGSVSGGGPVTLRGGVASADLALDAVKLAFGKFSVAAAKLAVKASKRIDQPGLAPFEAMDSDMSADLTDLRADTFAVDAAKLHVTSRNALVTLHTLDVRRAENSVTAHGTWHVPRDFKDAATAPTDGEFAIKVPKLADFGIAANGQTLSGHLDGSGALKLVDKALAGGVTLDGGDFQLGEFKAQSLAAKITVADNTATVEKFALKLAGTDQLTATGKAGVQAPFPYEAATVLDIKNLAALQPLLAVFNVKQTLAGSLHLEWNGKGEDVKKDAPLEQTGTLAVALEKGRFDKTDLSEVKLAGLYGPGFAQSTELHVLSGPTDFTGVLELKEGKLRLHDLNLVQSKLTVLTGYLIVPFDFDHPQEIIPLDGRIAANLNATKLDLEKLLTSFGQTSPVAGNITANLVAGGTLLAPLGHLKLAARALKSPAVALEPADLDLDLHYSNKELTLNAVAKQPQLQPLTIKGHVPLDLDATITGKKIDPTLPLDLTLQLPASSLAVVPKLAPTVRRIEGTAAVDLRVAGTVEKPVLSGSAALELKGARMVDENIPALGVFHAKLGFAGDTLTLTTFDGELGGGTFKLGGTIKVPKLTEPVFDLHLLAKEVLLKRDDSITIRADSDVKVAGPLRAGVVTGALFLTQSRFFKEIDILPIALPGKKAKPAPHAVQNRDTTVSIPALADWKFDLAIKTRPNDSFLIRGNLANGMAAVDLKFAGTGLEPYLDGSIRIESFKASLPFSTLSVSRGFVYFKKDEPFAPSLDLQAESQFRDYLVHAYIYGRAAEPQIQLSSEPPLPYADIVSLLATGTTASELGANANALASRAAMLAVQQLYRKVFHRTAAPPPDDKKPDAANFADRFQIELGALDNRTGGQEINTRFRMTDNLFFLGDIGVDGRFTGSLKYLIRFR